MSTMASTGNMMATVLCVVGVHPSFLTVQTNESF